MVLRERESARTKSDFGSLNLNLCLSISIIHIVRMCIISSQKETAPIESAGSDRSDGHLAQNERERSFYLGSANEMEIMY